jgi:hypothetical protein
VLVLCLVAIVQRPHSHLSRLALADVVQLERTTELSRLQCWPLWRVASKLGLIGESRVFIGSTGAYISYATSVLAKAKDKTIAMEGKLFEKALDEIQCKGTFKTAVLAKLWFS